MTARLLWQRARPVRSATILVLLYLALAELFAWLTPTQGLVSPDGAVAPPLLVLGAAVIGMRVVVLAFVPGLLTFRLVRWAATRLRDRSVGGGPAATAATRPGD